MDWRWYMNKDKYGGFKVPLASGLQEEYVHEGSLKGMRKGKRKLGDGSQDLDSSYTADGDEPWLGSHNAEGADEHASKRHKVADHFSKLHAVSLHLMPENLGLASAFAVREKSCRLSMTGEHCRCIGASCHVREHRSQPACRHMLPHGLP